MDFFVIFSPLNKPLTNLQSPFIIEIYIKNTDLLFCTSNRQPLHSLKLGLWYTQAFKYFPNQASKRDHARSTASWLCSPNPVSFLRSMASGDLFMNAWPTFGYKYTSDGTSAFFKFSSNCLADCKSSRTSSVTVHSICFHIHNREWKPEIDPIPI